MNTQVRELTLSDISLIADYWTQASPEHLLGMGADPAKLPPRDHFIEMLSGQLALPYDQKAALALIWLLDEVPVGHCNVNQIQFGDRANMHLHLWKPISRQRGLGTELVSKSIPVFFEKLALNTLYCEPYALNPAPNKTLSKVGFTFVKKYLTIPGSINFEQEVIQWKMERNQELFLVFREK